MNKCTWASLVLPTIVLVLLLAAPVACQDDLAAVALSEAKLLFDDGNYDGALAILDCVTSVDSPVSSYVLGLLGDCYRIKQEFAKAMQAYECALNKSQTSVQTDALSDLMPRLHRGLITCHIRLKKWDEVANEIDATSLENPTFAPWWYYAQGKRFLRSNDFKNGAIAFGKAIDFCKDNPNHAVLKDSKRYLAECNIETREWQKAVDTIVGLEATYKDLAATWHYLRGRALQGQNKSAEAIVEFESAVATSVKPDTDPDVKLARQQLSQMYRSSEQWNNAIVHLQALLNDYPKEGAVWGLELGKCYMDSGKTDQAIAAFKNIIEHFPDAKWRTWDAHFYLADCLYTLNRGEEALKIQKDFYEERPHRNSEYLMTTGRTYLYAANDPAKAQEYFEKFLSQYPHDPIARGVKQWYAVCQSQTGQTAKAIETLTALLPDCETAEEKAETLFNLAYCSYWTKDYALARADFDRVYAESKIDKYTAAAKYMVGDCYAKLNDKISARMALEGLAVEFKDTKWEKLAKDRISKL